MFRLELLGLTKQNATPSAAEMRLLKDKPISHPDHRVPQRQSFWTADKVHTLTGGPTVKSADLNCRTLDLTHCRMSNWTMICVSMAFFMTIVYFILYCYYIKKRMNELRQLSHQNHKVNNLYVRIQVSPPRFIASLQSYLFLQHDSWSQHVKLSIANCKIQW